MPRTKQNGTEQKKVEQIGHTITIEVSLNLYAQIESAAKRCGYTPDEWILFEAIMDKI